MQSTFQKTFSYTMAVRGLLDGGSVMGFRSGKGGGLWQDVGGSGTCFREFVSGLVAWYALMTWNAHGDGLYPCLVAGK